MCNVGVFTDSKVDAVRELADKLEVPFEELKVDKGDHWEEFSGTPIIKE